MNYNQVLHKIKKYTLSLPYVSSAHIGDIYEYLNGKPNVIYATTNIDITESTRNDNLTSYNVYLYYVDRLTQDKSNHIEIKTTAEQVLNSIVNYASTIGDITDGWTIRFFEQQFTDYCAGGYVQFQLDVPNLMGNCIIEKYEDEGIDPDVPEYSIIDDNVIVSNKTWSSYKINEELSNKQDTLVPGDNISIDENNVISAVDTTYSAGNNISIGENNEINALGYRYNENLNSIAIGDGTTASGQNSFAEGLNTKTSSNAEHAEGMYNQSHTGTIHSTGIGTAENARKNAFEVMNNGDVYVFGVGDYDGTKTKTQDNKVQTLQDVIGDIKSDITDLNDFTCETIVPTTTNFVPGTEYTIHEALQRTANLFGGFQGEIDDINGLIPNQATTQNQLADKDFVNSTVATNAANFRGNWINWESVPTTVSDYPADYTGSKTPTNNDYLVVLDGTGYGSSYTGMWRFIYVGDWTTNGKNGWNPQYQIGTAFTAAQQAAIDSGITSTKVTKYDGYDSKITALETDKLDKVYTASKIYGTNTLGQQTTYTAGAGVTFDDNKISTSFDISNYIHQGVNNIETDTPLCFKSEKDGVSYVCIRNDHSELVGKTLHKAHLDDFDGFDRGIEYRISPDKVIFQSVSTYLDGVVESVNAEYKQTSKKILLTGGNVVLNSINSDSNINVGSDIIKLLSPNIENSANDILNDVQNKFTICQNGEKCVDINKGGTHILTRLDVSEPERGNSLRLKKDGFETIVINSNGKQNWMKTTAGGNPFAFGVWNDENINDGGKTALLNTLPNGNIYIYGVDGYDGITTQEHRSLQKVIEDFEDNINNINYDITDLQNDKQDVLDAGDGIEINGNVISATGGGGGIVTKNAQIRVIIADCATYENLCVWVSTSVGTYHQHITSAPTEHYDYNFDFDIQYTNVDPLVKITVTSNTNVNIRYYYGFWIDDESFDDNYNFKQNLSPMPLALIGWQGTRSHEGNYRGFSFQINLTDYDINTDGRVEVCRVQTSTLCYAEDTLITLSDGTTKKVQDITYDDVLKVWNFDEGKSDNAKPIWIKIEQTANKYALIKLSDGNSIKLVGTDGKYHCMYDIDEQKFNHAIDCVGHNVYTENGIVKVESLEIVNEPVKFYNIVTNVHLNCYANHILTSTEKNNIYPINDMKFVKDNREFKPYEAFKDYGISLDEYEGWRLAEQPMSVEECVEFVKQRKQTQL